VKFPSRSPKNLQPLRVKEFFAARVFGTPALTYPKLPPVLLFTNKAQSKICNNVLEKNLAGFVKNAGVLGKK
jgi:hypothetical protein